MERTAARRERRRSHFESFPQPPDGPANDESPDSEQPGGTDGPFAYVYRALGLHRTPPRAPKGCRL